MLLCQAQSLFPRDPKEQQKTTERALSSSRATELNLGVNTGQMAFIVFQWFLKEYGRMRKESTFKRLLFLHVPV